MTNESKLDAITYEVVRNRLVSLSDEMCVTLRTVSGSPTVTDASDFFTGLLAEDGAVIAPGFQVSIQAVVTEKLVQHINTNPKVQVREGDMFIGNDPYIGALHQNDVGMVGPVYADGRIIAWAGAMAHQTDIGGMDFASWCPKAKEIWQEGLRIPCVKLVDQGELREDVLEMILSASRLPNQVGLDISAFMATINVARDRLQALVDRYSSSKVVEVMHRMVDSSETQMRSRLEEFPDVEMHICDYLEHDGHTNKLYKVDMVMAKRGDRLSFDFSGSSKQAPGFINCTRAGLDAAVAGAVMATLAYDIQWNEGVINPLEITAPDGLICTAKFPAPVGAATVEAMFIVMNTIVVAMNKLMAMSPKYRYRSQGLGMGTIATFNVGGVDERGEQFGLHLLDILACGSGAFSTKDGVDVGSTMLSPCPQIPDVERNEQAYPLFYFYRRLAVDTGGAGKYRGGVSAEIAMTLRGVKQAGALIMTHGAEVPNAQGMSGGWPGATVYQSMRRIAVKDGELVDGKLEEYGPKPGMVPMTDQDVFVSSWQGGGGWGDPLERDIDAVVQDVAKGIVSLEAALKIYGVVITDGQADNEATAQERDRICHSRVGEFIADKAKFTQGEHVGKLNDSLFLIRDNRGIHVTTPAGYILCTGTSSWRAGAVAVTSKELSDEYHIKLHDDLVMTTYYCPASGMMLSADIHERDQKPWDDMTVHLESLLETLSECA